MVGLGRVELPTSSLSGTRSSQLSYRPGSPLCPGGADRDRTDDLLNASQALSQTELQPRLPQSPLPKGFREDWLSVFPGYAGDEHAKDCSKKRQSSETAEQLSGRKLNHG